MSSTKNKGADGRKSVVSLDILILSLITHLELLVAIPIYAYIIFLFKFFPPAEDMQSIKLFSFSFPRSYLPIRIKFLYYLIFYLIKK